MREVFVMCSSFFLVESVLAEGALANMSGQFEESGPFTMNVSASALGTVVSGPLHLYRMTGRF